MYYVRVVILADKRFNKHDKRAKFPPWITSFMKDNTSLDLSTDLAIEQVKVFLKVMGQPIDDDELKTILLTEEQINNRQMHNINATASLSSSSAISAAGGGGVI